MGDLSIEEFTDQINSRFDILHIESFKPSHIKNSRLAYEIQDLFYEDMNVDSMYVFEAGVYARSSVSPWLKAGSLYWLFPYRTGAVTSFRTNDRSSVIIVTEKDGSEFHQACLPEQLQRVMTEFENRLCMRIHVDMELFNLAEKRYAEQLASRKRRSKGCESAQ